MSFPVVATCEVMPNGKPCGGGPEEAPTCHGKIELKQVDADNCEISYEITGLAPGKHGFHVHEKADFSNGCVSAGPHYNPFGKTHGGPQDTERHVGDLGNVEADSNGVAKGRIVDSLVKLVGEHTVVGRSLMVHADSDCLGKGGFEDSLTTGHAGARIACGEIKLV
eukprot:NODE_5429_length_655_cov_120.799242_g5266_i0.p1 GENE.NODE_5429_length_655_cov_120.799242_g5266_i0~~NODE_5429_length_655_cov_120.799242_g5266_i0.p1  ORF type:complete len:166 (+),score=16.79 NODE_5429_length_655_cov_120.799242_g5266_i0:64-561(+)